MAIPSTLDTLGGEIIVIIAIALLLYVVYKIGKSLLKIILGIIINSILGVGVVWLVDLIFKMGIPLKIYTLIPLALFGLPAAGTLIILRFFGVVI
ncbi:MAG: pro-sigmaK processing inhibitor BofA family protein [Candidatus Micrarchaeota archaeon]|nr:pro-sigmaK processing inhibitor BofA family protein [Candidatus Micrarchaeota archaeon]